MNPNVYKLYTRLDAQGNKISGSSVKRKTMPRTGKWVQEDVNVCCFPYTYLEFTTDGALTDMNAIIINCSASPALEITLPALVNTTTKEELLDYLNTNFSYLGDFVESTDGIALKFKQEIGNSICGDLGDLTFELTEQP